MKLTIKTKQGTFIHWDTENDLIDLSHPLFKLMENFWWEWYEDREKWDNQIEQMYFSDYAIFDKKGAIYQAIETLEEVAQESKKTFFNESEFYSLDIDCAFY